VTNTCYVRVEKAIDWAGIVSQ